MSAKDLARRTYGKDYVDFAIAQYRDCVNSREGFKILRDMLPILSKEEVKEICDNSGRTLQDRRGALVGGRRCPKTMITAEVYEQIIQCRKNGITERKTAEIIGCSESTIEKYTKIAKGEGRL